MRRATGPTDPARGGVTLLELLIVITVLMMLVGVALPTMKPALEARQVREAARAINIYLSSARAAAMESGRPCGVMIQRLDVEPLCSMELAQAQMPPGYAGDTVSAWAQVERGGGAGPGFVQVTFSDFSPAILQSLRIGDLVQFNHQGPHYRIEGPDGNGDGFVDGLPLTLWVDVTQGLQLPWPEQGKSAPMPYEIIRGPTKSYARPTKLPGNAAIDLQFSGCEDHVLGAGKGGPIYILFSPDGSVYRAYHDGHVHHVTEPIYLLVGRRDLVPAPAAGGDPLPNYQDTRNFWITLNPQTGLVTTVEVAARPGNNSGIPADVTESRSLAREAQSIGGR